MLSRQMVTLKCTKMREFARIVKVVSNVQIWTLRISGFKIVDLSLFTERIDISLYLKCISNNCQNIL